MARSFPAALPAALSGANLHLSYGTHEVVHGVDLDLTRGCVTALIGPNGSGKSTVLRSLARLHRAETGAVSLEDVEDVMTLHPKAFARRVTMLSQSRPTPGGVTVRDVVGFGRHPYRGRFRTSDPDGPRAIEHALDITGVSEMAGRGVDELSGGELQRVWLATCLAQDTEVLLLDEPTNHLDLRYQMDLLDLVRDLATEHRVAIGVVLHDLNHAATVADRVVLLQHGGVRAVGTPGEVLTTELLSEVYGIHVDVHAHPVSQRPVCEPRSRHAAARQPAPLVPHHAQLGRIPAEHAQPAAV
ncbi:ABC transporter ATP-binding protein [Ornithinimicrobium murale]|uniref:ABC transporter ATP-binding protein n=1 Tax=Ornithinimicrobium murale TaxID=1050153 RepID=UPI000E0CD99C|nr:ABC transporter ATP-binding protein [Ornithinimicrobium murale]